SYAYTIIDFGNLGAAEYELSFDWKSGGESTWDFFKVYLLPIDAEIPATGFPSTPDISGILNLSDGWERATYILPTSLYENTAKKLLFVWKNDASGGNGVSAAVDNIQIIPVTCATPSNLIVSSTDQTSATLSWNENGTSTSWLIEYSFNGINWTSELASTNTDFVLSNLNPSSTYQVRVYSLCSSIDTSSFVSNVFQTECGVISQFPWLEGFEDAFVGTSASNSLSAAPRCWSNFNGGYTSTTYQWKRGTTASNIYAGAGYAYMDGYGSTTSATYTNNDWLITPVLQLTGNERLNFWIKKEGSTYTPDLAIYVLDITNGDVNATDSISNFTLLTNIPDYSISTTYQQQEVDLSSLNGQYRLAFVRLQPSQYDLYVDEVKVSALPNCRRVSDVALSYVSHEEATITWTPGQETDASWNIYLTQGSSTVTIPATQIPTTITNLLPNTDYSFVVKTDCGTEESDPTIPISFTTSCTPISVPFLEEFNTSPLTNDCWKQHNGLLADTVVFTSNTSSWAYNNNAYPAASPITSMRLNIWSTTTRSWLITPTIDLGNTSNLYQLEFDVTNSNLAMLVPGVLTGVDDKFAVVISTDNGLTWTSANAHIWSNETGATRVYNDLMSTTPIHIIIPLQDENLIPYQGLIKVGFYGESTVSNADNYLNIDNVAINEWADCQRPTGLAVNGVSFDQATISFTEQGTATSWEYSLGEVVTGVDNDPNAGTIVSIFDNPHTIQGLTPSTDYYIAVRSDCMSPWSDIVTFRTAALNVTTFPYTATFDEFDPESYNWTSLSNSVNRWVVGNATSSNLGTSTDLSSAYISFNDGDSNSATTATTRAYFYRDFDFGSTPTTYDLSFDWKCLGTYTSSTNTVSSGIMVIPCETTDSINLGGLPLNQNQRVLMLHSQTDWQNATAQLDNMSGVKRLIFYTWGYSSSNRYNPAAIDNITIEQSTCARPNGLVAANLTTNSADITWNGSADSYILTYRASNDTTDTYMSQIGTAASLSNLLPGTSYYVWVKSICGTDTTINSVSLSFRTPCDDNAITTFPYNEGFESGLSCWTQDYTVGTIDWTNPDYYNSTSTPAHGGQKLAYFYDNSFSGYTTKLVSPLLDISGLATPYVSFWHLQKAWGSDQDELKVFYRASSDSSWTQLFHFTSNITAWQLDSVALPSASSTYQIAFEGIQNYGYGVGLDDITVYDANSNPCSPPTDITVTPSNITANMTWTAGGGEASWEVRLGETGTPETVSSTSHSLSGLTPNTTYTVYVRANCGESFSAWIPKQFTTTTDPTPPIVTTAVPTTLITQTTAVFNGEYVETSSPILTKGFEY
ncbi:MAG: choice-of-anchor J domain-containing protein, partial [Anaerostipes sp.]|nr:choice-of-anchor J domain-containing protein [Anaerostipes sp.]